MCHTHPPICPTASTNKAKIISYHCTAVAFNYYLRRSTQPARSLQQDYGQLSYTQRSSIIVSILLSMHQRIRFTYDLRKQGGENSESANTPKNQTHPSQRMAPVRLIQQIHPATPFYLFLFFKTHFFRLCSSTKKKKKKGPSVPHAPPSKKTQPTGHSTNQKSTISRNKYVINQYYSPQKGAMVVCIHRSTPTRGRRQD